MRGCQHAAIDDRDYIELHPIGRLRRFFRHTNRGTPHVTAGRCIAAPHPTLAPCYTLPNSSPFGGVHTVGSTRIPLPHSVMSLSNMGLVRVDLTHLCSAGTI